MKAIVKPKSKHAKNRFANMLKRDPNVFVRVKKDDSIFLSDAEQNYGFWVSNKICEDVYSDDNWYVRVIS